MPIYEYECPKCQAVKEIMQKISDPVLEACPDCAGPVKKLMSLSSFALKGTGWYTTDYKKGTTGPSVTPKSSEKKDEAAKSADAPKAAEAPAAKPDSSSTPATPASST